MNKYADMGDFLVMFDEIENAFYIASKDKNDKVTIGPFATAAEAISFGHNRVTEK